MLEAAMSKAPLQEANVEELCENNHDDIEDPQQELERLERELARLKQQNREEEEERKLT